MVLGDRKILVINEDDPAKSEDVQKLRMQSLSQAVFQPFSEAYYGKTYRDIPRASLEALSNSFNVVSLSSVKDKKINWKKYCAVVGSGMGVANFVAGGNLKTTKVRDILYRKNDLLPEGAKEPVAYWGVLSSWKLAQMFQYPHDPENKLEQIQLYRAVNGIYDYLNGDLPISTMTASKIVTTVDEVRTLVEYCAYTGEAVYDFETKPIKEGLEKQKDMLKHSTEFHLSQPTMMSVSFQTGSAWLVPMYHHESPFDIGKDDTLELVEGTRENKDKSVDTVVYVHKNGKAITKYNGKAIIYDEHNKPYIDAMFANLHHCREHNIGNYLVDLVFPELVKLFNRPDIRNTAHNYKFDRKIVRRWLGVRDMLGRQDDTMMMVHSNREDVEKGLKVVSPKYWPEFFGYGEDVDYANDSLKDLGHYACVDTDLTFRVRIMEERKMLQDPDSYRVYRSLEVPKLRVLSDIEYVGMPIDTVYMKTAKKQVKEMIELVHAELMELPIVKRYIHTARKAALDKELNRLQTRLQTFTERKLKDLDGQYERWDAKPKTEATKMRLAEIRMKRHKVEGLKYYQSTYPYKDAIELFNEWKKLSTGEKVLDYKLSFRSPKQMGDVLYTSPVGYRHEMPLVSRKITNPETRRKETIVHRYPTTDKDELGKLQDTDGFIQKLLEYRLLVLIRDTYLTGIRDRLDEDLRVHCSFPTVRSQRLSSRNPNLQNIPSRTKLTRVKDMVGHVKRMFIPDAEGKEFYQVDLSQAELRWAAYLWEVPSLIKAYKEGKDVHIIAAAMSKGWTYQGFLDYRKQDPKAADYLRFQAKAYNFGLIYGMSAESFREYCQVQYGVFMTLEEATKIRNLYLNQLHSAIPAAHEVWKAKGRRDGFVRTAYGSKRHVPSINSKNGENRSHDERVCLNSPVQGSSGQGLIFSMICFSDWMTATHLDGTIINTVHDSINGYVAAEHKEDYLTLMLRACNTPPNREYFGFDLNDKLPMESDAEAGRNWKDLEAFKKAA
jgi:DNA polymerase I-like protein with 3'-5' exonuclease and polymerase domains